MVQITSVQMLEMLPGSLRPLCVFTFILGSDHRVFSQSCEYGDYQYLTADTSDVLIDIFSTTDVVSNVISTEQIYLTISKVLPH